jgi:phage pi2 protein 07
MNSFVKCDITFMTFGNDKKPRFREGTIDLSSNILLVPEDQREMEVAWVIHKILKNKGEKWKFMNKSIYSWGIKVTKFNVQTNAQA